MAAGRLTATELITKYLTKGPGVSILPKDVGADETGSAFDATGFELVMGIIVVAAASASTDFTWLAQNSATEGGAYTDIADARLNPGQPDVVNDDAAGNHNKAVAVMIRPDPAKPWLKWQVDGVGGTQALLAAALFIPVAPLTDLKPYELDQIRYELDRRGWDQGSGEPPSNQPLIEAIIT